MAFSHATAADAMGMIHRVTEFTEKRSRVAGIERDYSSLQTPALHTPNLPSVSSVPLWFIHQARSIALAMTSRIWRAAPVS